MVTVLSRVAFAVALVLLTWNPSRWSYFDWALRDVASIDAVKAFFGVLLLGGWVVCVRAAWTSLGALGLLLVAALLGTLIWMLVQFGLVPASSTQAFVWIVLVAVGVALGIGVSWSKVRQAATGQVEVD